MAAQDLIEFLSGHDDGARGVRIVASRGDGGSFAVRARRNGRAGRLPVDRHQLGPAIELGDRLQHDLQADGDRHGQNQADQAPEVAPEQAREQDGRAVQVERAAHDQGRDHVALDADDGQVDGRHDQGVADRAGLAQRDQAWEVRRRSSGRCRERNWSRPRPAQGEGEMDVQGPEGQRDHHAQTRR